MKAKKKVTKKASSKSVKKRKAVLRKAKAKDTASPVQMVRELFDRAFAAQKLRLVWNIVSAMRGPDDEAFDKKADLTTPLRRVVLRSKHVAGGVLYVSNWESYTPACAHPDTVKSLVSSSIAGHFEHHVRIAAKAMQEK